jgi:hypothetical protein
VPYQILSSDKILRIGDFTLLNLVQSADWSPNFNAQDIYELGQTGKVDASMELETSGSFDTITAGGMPGILARMMVKRNGSGDFQGSEYASGGANGKNAYTWTEANLKECVFDLLQHEKPDQLNFTRTVVFPRCFLTNFSFRLDAAGQGSETFNWAGDYVFGANTPYHDIRSIHATRTTSTTATMADTAMTGYTLLYVYVNERRFTRRVAESTFVTMSTGGVITFANGTGSTEGFTIAASDVIRVLVYKTTPSTTFPSIGVNDRYTTATSIRGYQADIFLAPANAATPVASELWLKVQNLDASFDLRTEALKQIKYNPLGTSTYARFPTFPINITVNASTYEYDWVDWLAVMNKVSTWDLGTASSGAATTLTDSTKTWTTNAWTNYQVVIVAGTGVGQTRTILSNTATALTVSTSWTTTPDATSQYEIRGTAAASDPYFSGYELSPTQLKSTFKLVADLRTKNGTRICRWTFNDLRLDGYGNRISVGGRGEVSWSFQGSSFQVQGFNV